MRERVEQKGRHGIRRISGRRRKFRDTTAYLLSSPRNAVRLFAALKRARRSECIPMTVESLREAYGLVEGR